MIRVILMAGLSIMCVMGHSRVWANDGDRVRAQIQLLENTQSIDPGGWRPWIEHAEASVRQRAVRSIGRIDHPRLIRFIQSTLSDTDPLVRAEAAFAYGQSTILNVHPLLEKLKTETDARVKAALFTAIGKRGQGHHVSGLLEHMKTSDVELHATVLSAINRISRGHDIQSTALNEFLARTGFSQSSPAMRRAWAEALAIAPHEGCSARAEAVQACVQDPDAEIRSRCTEATVCLDNGHDLRMSLVTDPEWRVRASLASAMAESSDVSGLVRALHFSAAKHRIHTMFFDHGAFLNGTELVVLSGLLEACSRVSSTKELTRVVESLWRSKDRFPSDIHCGLAAILDRSGRRIKRTKSCGGPSMTHSQRHPWQLKALRYLSPKKYVRRVIKLYEDADVVTRVLALESLSRFPKDPRAVEQIAHAMVDVEPVIAIKAIELGASLDIPDHDAQLKTAYEIHSAAKNHGVTQRVFEHWGRRHVEASLDILENHLEDRQPGIRRVAGISHRAVQKAVRAERIRAGQSPTRSMRKRTSVPPPSAHMGNDLDLRLGQPAPYSMAKIYTDHGIMHITLYRDSALNTVKHFINLVEKSRYNGVLFHSMEPGQWIRVGDPTTTGYGGFEPNRRCEIHPARFERGRIGMYHLNRDGGGAQLIVAQRAIPELDGRYTVFGEVTDGFPVLDALRNQDRIIKVELLSSP